MKQAKPCWVKKFSALETFRIIWKSGLSVPLLYPSDYPSQCQSLVKHLRTHSIHLAGPHVIIFFIDCHYNVNWRHHHSTHYPLGSKRMFSLSSYKLIPGIWFFFFSTLQMLNSRDRHKTRNVLLCSQGITLHGIHVRNIFSLDSHQSPISSFIKIITPKLQEMLQDFQLHLKIWKFSIQRKAVSKPPICIDFIDLM